MLDRWKAQKEDKPYFHSLQKADGTLPRKRVLEIHGVDSELLKQNPPPDKKTNQLEWVQHMNALRTEAEELVCDELIYN